MSNEMEVGLDKEGQEVLAELEKQGFEIAGREKPAEEPKPQEPAQPEKPVEPQKPAEPVKPQQPAPAEPQNPQEPQTPNSPRKIQHVPLPKYLETEKNLKEALAKIEELSKPGATPNKTEVVQAQDAVKILEEKFGYDHEEAAKLAEVIKAIIPGQGLSKEQQEALAELNNIKQTLSQREEALRQQQEEVLFEKDFTEQIVKDFPQLNTQEHKKIIKEMAYTDEYSKVPLRTIALAYMDAEGINPSSQDVIVGDKAGGGGNKGAETVNFDNLTEEQFNKLSPEEQDKFFAYQDQKERQNRGALSPLR